MAIKIGINGYGRIGRDLHRQLLKIKFYHNHLLKIEKNQNMNYGNILKLIYG